MHQTKKLASFLQFTKFLVFILILNFAFSTHLFAQEATGGDEVYEIEIDHKVYRVHVFTTVGNHQLTVNEDLEIDVLVVAGGGGGAGKDFTTMGSIGRGGGGAGGIVFRSNYLVSGNTSISLYVGNGGSGSSWTSGQNSSFDNLIALGGGRGETNQPNHTNSATSGGSGGGGYGASSNVNAFGLGLQPSSNSGGFGNNGGSYFSSYAGGGGGGAGSVGNHISNYGGIGMYFGDIYGESVGQQGWFSGGGGGGINGLGGIGGGGNGAKVAISNGFAAIANTGGGGGGAWGASRKSIIGGNGGSGIVIVRYEISSFNLNINNIDQDITPTKTSPEFTLSGTIDYPDDGDATSVTVSASIGGVNRSLNVPVSADMTWQLSWNYNELTEEEYTNIEFTATSNSSEPEEATSTYTGKIIIDKTAPVCGTWNPPTSSWRPRSSKSFTLSGSTDTGGSGIDISGGVCNTGPNHGDQCVIEIKDQAGNTTLCPSPVNNIDIFPPQLQVTPPIPGWQGNKQSIIIEPSDDKTGIKRTAYSWLVNNLGSDCTGGDTYNPGDDLRLTIMGGENTLYTCTVDNAGNTTFSSQIYRYIPPILTTPKLQKNVKPSNLYWNIESISETQSYVEVKGFFPKTKGNYNYALELIIPTINKSYSQALQTSPFSETHFTILIPTSDFNASKDNHTFSGPQKLKITDLDEMESTTTDLNLSFFFPIHQSNHRRDFNYFILAGDNRLNTMQEP